MSEYRPITIGAAPEGAEVVTLPPLEIDSFRLRPIGWSWGDIHPRHEGVVHLFGVDYDLWSTAGRISGITPRHLSSWGMVKH